MLHEALGWDIVDYTALVGIYKVSQLPRNRSVSLQKYKAFERRPQPRFGKAWHGINDLAILPSGKVCVEVIRTHDISCLVGGRCASALE